MKALPLTTPTPSNLYLYSTPTATPCICFAWGHYFKEKLLEKLVAQWVEVGRKLVGNWQETGGNLMTSVLLFIAEGWIRVVDNKGKPHPPS